jgi:hypothetical protein
MRNLLLFFFAAFLFIACNNNKDKKAGSKKTGKAEYTITKDGIGDLKIGMSDAEVSKLLNQQFSFENNEDAPNYWQDTIKAKYKELPVSLIFSRHYVDDDSTYWDLIVISTSSPLCKTETGLGIGDEKSEIFPLYDDSPITMMPDYEQVNDSTWNPSKTKFTIYVKDANYDKELVFRLTNKKITALEAGIVMGE